MPPEDSLSPEETSKTAGVEKILADLGIGPFLEIAQCAEYGRGCTRKFCNGYGMINRTGVEGRKGKGGQEMCRRYRT